MSFTARDADITPPVVTGCPPGVTVTVNVGETGGIARWTEPTATDNSGASPARDRSHPPGSIFSVGTTRVTYTFTDASQNSATCSFNVVVSTGNYKLFYAYFTTRLNEIKNSV